mmetsp:Transcript_14381/g.36672  ORF Transcript_14381/g.36672 Transcript_14381/m.36672 type:complete len:84 (-) Transcript_14381:1261-1512(-)
MHSTANDLAQFRQEQERAAALEQKLKEYEASLESRIAEKLLQHQREQEDCERQKHLLRQKINDLEKSVADKEKKYVFLNISRR